MSKRQSGRNHKVWLPPIYLCCEKASFYLEVNINFNSSLIVKCPEHGTEWVENPLRKSHFDVLIVPSHSLFKLIWENLSEKERALFTPRILEYLRKKPKKVSFEGETAPVELPLEAMRLENEARKERIRLFQEARKKRNRPSRKARKKRIRKP